MNIWIDPKFRFVFAGPLSGYLIEKFGERKVAIVGSLISAIGITSSAFVNSVPVLILTYGVISGKFSIYIYICSLYVLLLVLRYLSTTQ